MRQAETNSRFDATAPQVGQAGVSNVPLVAIVLAETTGFSDLSGGGAVGHVVLDQLPRRFASGSGELLGADPNQRLDPAELSAQIFRVVQLFGKAHRGLNAATVSGLLNS